MIRSLWRQRQRPPFASLRFFKQWAKRVLTLRTLVETQLRSTWLCLHGARVHPSACLSSAHFQGQYSNLEIGSHTFVGRASIQLHAPVTVGSNVCINDGVEVITGSHTVGDAEWRMYTKPVVIEDHAWIATGATILPGVTVGKGAVVGARAVVRKSVPPFAVVVGNPATPIETQRPENLRYDPTKFLAFQEAWLGNAHIDRNPKSSR